MGIVVSPLDKIVDHSYQDNAALLSEINSFSVTGAKAALRVRMEKSLTTASTKSHRRRAIQLTEKEQPP
jgi:hypothetical protein